MNKNVNLFVYGTLLSGLRNHYLLFDKGHVCSLVTKGMLRKPKYFVHNGSYPAVIEKEPNKDAKPVHVLGEVWSVPRKLITTILDTLEGYSPSNVQKSFYLRKKAHIISIEDGLIHIASIYVLNPAYLHVMNHICTHGNYRKIDGI